MYIDTNNILCIGPEIQGKTYTIFVGGYVFSSLDKEVLVYHKKEFKNIHLKDLGNQMAVFYIKKEKQSLHGDFCSQMFLSGMMLFAGFDEETGQIKSFLYKFSPSQIETKNKELKKLSINLEIVRLSKGVYIQPFCGKTAYDFFKEGFLKTSKDWIEFFCGLSVLYGKPTAKGTTLFAWTWQIPLFGQYMAYQDMFLAGIQYLQSQGYFMSYSVVNNQQGCVVQITTRDYELLENLQSLYKPLANYEQISTKTVVLELLPFLENFLKEKKTDEKLLEIIKNSNIKLLIKS